MHIERQKLNSNNLAIVELNQIQL